MLEDDDAADLDAADLGAEPAAPTVPSAHRFDDDDDAAATLALDAEPPQVLDDDAAADLEAADLEAADLEAADPDAEPAAHRFDDDDAAAADLEAVLRSRLRSDSQVATGSHHAPLR